MSKITLIILGLVVIFVLGGLLVFQNITPPEQETSSVENRQGQNPVMITYTDSGYVPREVAVSQGTQVVFENKSSRPTWPATALHPTHTVYPGSDIQKCFRGEREGIFDACESIAPGASWSFMFNEIGTWGYHDHLDVSYTGRITVE